MFEFKFELKRTIRELEDRIASLKQELASHLEDKIKISALGEENRKLAGEVIDLKNKVREQTEADLFFITSKIQKELLDGKKKEDVSHLFNQQLSMQQQLSAMQQQNTFMGLGRLF